MIARPAPAPSQVSSTSVLGFLPVQAAPHRSWLSLDRASSSISLMDGDKVVAVVKAQGLESARSGSFQVIYKQKNAPWYAPDSYFSARNLAVPSAGDKSRFRRGALGEYVIFLAKDLPIHSGPVWSSEVGGIQLKNEELSKLFYALDVGAPIEIR